MMRLTLRLAVAVGAAALTAPAYADRPPTPDERADIESALRDAGFTSWGEIELDEEERDAYWWVEDARTEEGRSYDLELAPDSLEILERHMDD